MQTSYQHLQNPSTANPLLSPSSDEHDEIRRTLGATQIYLLRQTYGAGFAPGEPGDLTLGEVLEWLDKPSIALLARRLHG